MLEKIEQQTFRAAKIVNGLLNLSRSGGSKTDEAEPVDLNAIIGDVLSLLEPQLMASKVKVRRELCQSPALVEILFVIGQYTMLSMVANAAGICPVSDRADTRGGWQYRGCATISGFRSGSCADGR